MQQICNENLVGLAILDVPLPVKEPVGNLVLAGVLKRKNEKTIIHILQLFSGLAHSLERNHWSSYLHDGDKLLSILLGQLASPLGKRDVGLLQHNVSVPVGADLIYIHMSN